MFSVQMTDDKDKCDDGNKLPDDGCSDKCLVEEGWECKEGSPDSRDRCSDKCGDGLVYHRSTEDYCDDHNTSEGDGCNKDCRVETGYFCEGGDKTKKDECKEI